MDDDAAAAAFYEWGSLLEQVAQRPTMRA